MPIERKQPRVIEKRHQDDILNTNAETGKLLGLEPTPVFKLAYKERRLLISQGECHPLVDVLSCMAQKIKSLEDKLADKNPTRKRGPKKKSEDKMPMSNAEARVV